MPEQVVYFIEAVGLELIKIGQTRLLDDRIRSLATGSPVPLKLIGYIAGTAARERKLHKQFARDRAHGEWFRATPELRRYIAKAVKHSGHG